MGGVHDQPAVDDAGEGDDGIERRTSHRDVDLGGRDRLAAGRAAAASGDPGAAEALLAGVMGSHDPAVAGEAAAALGEAAALRARKNERDRRSRR